MNSPEFPMRLSFLPFPLSSEHKLVLLRTCYSVMIRVDKTHTFASAHARAKRHVAEMEREGFDSANPDSPFARYIRFYAALYGIDVSMCPVTPPSNYPLEMLV